MMRREPEPSTSQNPPLSVDSKLHAHAVAALRDPVTRRLLGYVYEWNTGEEMPAWLVEPVVQALREPH